MIFSVRISHQNNEFFGNAEVLGKKLKTTKNVKNSSKYEVE